MAMYEYRCTGCRDTTTLDVRVRLPELPCVTCGTKTTHKRVFSFTVQPMMHEHWNKAVGAPISDMGQFRRELKRRSEEATEHTGIEHSYVPVEHGDAAAVGATNEGIDESNRIRSKLGEPLLPEIK